MKKIHYLLAAIACLFILSSCEEGDTYYPTEYVYQYNKTHLNLHIESKDWQWDNNGFYYYTFSIPELTQNIYDNGTVHCYIEFYQGTSDAYQISLPHILTKTDGTDTYQQYIDYSYLVGQVEIALTNSDLKYDTTIKPESMDFHLALVW